jgi:H+/Cl- antiporter ClcA
MANKWADGIWNRFVLLRTKFHDQQIKTNFLQAIPFWLASLLTGLIAVLYTKLFNLSELLLSSVIQWHSWLIFIMAPLGFLAGWYVVNIFGPNAKGSGIPQVMAALELSSPKYEKGLSRLLSMRILVTKIVSSLFMVLGGAAIGREGPTIQIAGSVFRMVHKNIPANWPKTAQTSFILTGAAAGLAAAFNTPLGGIVFAIEELARIHLSFFRTALFTAVIIAGLTAQTFLGPYLYLGYPEVKDLHGLIFLAVIVVAIVAGLLGSLMGKIILMVMKWKKSLNKTQIIIFIIFAGLFIASIAFFMNDHVLGSGKNLMSEVLFTNHKFVSFQTMFLRILGPVVSFNTGAAGGVFAPSLAAGASVGGYISGIFGFADSNANILILSGMVAFLTGVTRTPFTSAILVVEMTDRHSVIFYLMLAALLASFAALLISKHSLYESLKKEYILAAKQENNV